MSGDSRRPGKARGPAGRGSSIRRRSRSLDEFIAAGAPDGPGSDGAPEVPDGPVTPARSPADAIAPDPVVGEPTSAPAGPPPDVTRLADAAAPPDARSPADVAPSNPSPPASAPASEAASPGADGPPAHTPPSPPPATAQALPAAPPVRAASPLGGIGLALAVGALALVLLGGQRLREHDRQLSDLQAAVADLSGTQQTLLQEAATRAAAPPTVVDPGPGPATWLRWLALDDLQLARQALAEGREANGVQALASAQAHLARLGGNAAAELESLGGFRDRLVDAGVLSPATLDARLIQLEADWRQLAAQTRPEPGWLPAWLADGWRAVSGAAGPSPDDLAGTGELRRLSDRLRQALVQGDGSAFAAGVAAMERQLTPLFIQAPGGRTWLMWLRELEKTPVRHDLAALDALIAGLSGRLVRDLCRSGANGQPEGCIAMPAAVPPAAEGGPR